MTKQSRSNSLGIDLDCHASFHSARNDIVSLDHLKDSPASFWIDSSGGPEKLCKRSFIGTNPKYYLYGSLNEITLEDCENGAISYIPNNCFDTLEEKIKEGKVNNPNGIFVGYISYDLFNNKNPKSISYPNFFFAFYENYDSIENLDSKFQTVDNNSPTPYPPPLWGEARSTLLSGLPLTSNMTDEEYLEKVDQIKEEIKAGNVYQANLTREYSLKTTDNPPKMGEARSTQLSGGQRTTELDLYLKLRSVSPNPYGCFFKTPFVTILSSSPEEFLHIGQEKLAKSYTIRTRPIKGTLPKGIYDIDPKNQAENLMIVDLERNDLGRICNPGTIKVSELLNIEKYEHLNHVVSSIEGKLKEDITLREIFEATFPGGSITGAPKIAAMKIIDEIEPTQRGAYTGSFGYIKTDGTMNFNILIRTMFITKTTDNLTFNVGGGIVADSDPQAELEEIRLKAKGIMNTLGIEGGKLV